MEHDGFDKNGRPEFCSDGNDSCIDNFLGKSAASRIWQTLWEWRTIDGTKSDFANSAGISRPSLYEAWPFFIEQEIIIPSRKIKGKQLYKMNPNHLLARHMMKLLDEFITLFIDEEMALEEVREARYKKWRKENENKSVSAKRHKSRKNK